MLKLTTLATPCRTKKTDFEKKKTIRICYFRSKIGFFDFLYRPNFCYCFFFHTSNQIDPETFARHRCTVHTRTCDTFLCQFNTINTYVYTHVRRHSCQRGRRQLFSLPPPPRRHRSRALIITRRLSLHLVALCTESPPPRSRTVLHVVVRRA